MFFFLVTFKMGTGELNSDKIEVTIFSCYVKLLINCIEAPEFEDSTSLA